jgi:hypothetical protein
MSKEVIDMYSSWQVFFVPIKNCTICKASSSLPNVDYLEREKQPYF